MSNEQQNEAQADERPSVLDAPVVEQHEDDDPDSVVLDVVDGRAVLRASDTAPNPEIRRVAGAKLPDGLPAHIEKEWNESVVERHLLGTAVREGVKPQELRGLYEWVAQSVVMQGRWPNADEFRAFSSAYLKPMQVEALVRTLSKYSH